MKPGDIYYRYGPPEPTGVITWPEEIFKREFATYMVVQYKITSDPRSNKFYDVIRLSDGPDKFLGVIEQTFIGGFHWTISHNPVNWDLPGGLTMREWVDSLRPCYLPGAAIEGFIRASERKLEANFIQLFQT